MIFPLLRRHFNQSISTGKYGFNQKEVRPGRLGSIAQRICANFFNPPNPNLLIHGGANV
jgi:hypothetical protein